MSEKRALVLVDLQNDFMSFGSLPVADGELVVPVANKLAQKLDFVVASQDWHPADHVSFASNHPGNAPGDVVKVMGEDQILWPDHCVQGTPGASFHSRLDVARIDAVICKGVDKFIDSYSTFFDNSHRRDTGLASMLGDREVKEVVLVGLATDYCVLWSALDAREMGFDVTVVTDGVRGVEMTPGDSERGLQRMRQAGCSLVASDELLGRQ